MKRTGNKKLWKEWDGEGNFPIGILKGTLHNKKFKIPVYSNHQKEILINFIKEAH